MNLTDDYKFIHLSIPHTGTRFLRKILKWQAGLNVNQDYPHRHFDGYRHWKELDIDVPVIISLRQYDAVKTSFENRELKGVGISHENTQ